MEKLSKSRLLTGALSFLFIVFAGCSASTATRASDTSNAVSEQVEELVAQPDVGSPDVCGVDQLSNRTDLTPQANKVSGLSIDLVNLTPLSVELPDTPAWVLPYESGESWYVGLTSGDAVIVSDDGSVEPAASINAEPPEIRSANSEDIEVVSAWQDRNLFDNPLPDARVAKDGDTWVALVEPTDLYPHAVIGDDLEAAAIQVLDVCDGTSTTIEIDAPDVIEGISPILADLDDDGELEIVVTVSNAEVGARLVAYSQSGELVGESDPIGQGNRWRNQMGVAPIGPNGEVELVSLRLPHINGVVEFFSLIDGRLVQTAESEGYTSHQIRSQNLDLGVIFDATDSDELNVVVPTQSRATLAVIGRTEDGAELLETIELDGRVVSNLSIDEVAQRVAVGTDANRLIVWVAQG